MADESAGSRGPRGEASTERIALQLPARLVAAARELVASAPATSPCRSLDALIGEALRRYLETAERGDASRALRGDGSGHTPDGWYD
jgi:hypothetical protein